MKIFGKVSSDTKGTIFVALAYGAIGGIVGYHAGIHITIAALGTTFSGTIPLAAISALFGGLIAHVETLRILGTESPAQPPEQLHVTLVKTPPEEVEGAEERQEIRQLRRETARLGEELSNAAREINCAGPVDHRIRVLKREHADCVRRLRKALREKGDH